MGSAGWWDTMLLSWLMWMTKKGDKVAITVLIPPPPEEGVEQDMEEAFTGEKPTFTASLWTGRTFPEMYEASADNILTLPQGMKGHVDMAFSSKVFDGLELVLPRELWHMRDVLKAIAAVSKLTVVNEIRYRSPEELADATKELPPFDAILEFGRQSAAAMPDNVRNAMKKLSKYADGLDTVELTGLPNNYMVNVKFTNFHLTPVLKSIIDEAAEGDAAEAAEGDADEGDAAEG